MFAGLRNIPVIVISTATIVLTMLVGCSAPSSNTASNQWDYRPPQTAQQNAQRSPNRLDTLPPAPTQAQIQAQDQMHGLLNHNPTHQPAPNQPNHQPSLHAKHAPPPQKSRSAQPAKVAILVPLSGKHKDIGQALLNAAQLALFDLGTNNFQLIPKDTQGTPEGARAAANAALSEGSELIIGPLFAQSLRAVKPLAQSQNVNILSFSTDWNLAGGNTYIMGFLPFDQVERLTSYLPHTPYNRVGVLAPNTSYGRTVLNTFNGLAPRYGTTIAKQQTFDPRLANLAPTVQQFSHYTPNQTASQYTQPTVPYNAVLLPIGGDQVATIANLMTQYNLPPNTIKRLGTGLWDDAFLTREGGMEGAWFAAPSPNLRKDFENKYLEAYGRKSPRLATLAYDATALAAVLARNNTGNIGANPYTRYALMNNNGFFGIDGIFRFRQDGTAERGLAMLEIRNGRLVVIDEAPTTFQ